MYIIKEKLADNTTKFLAQAPTRKDAQDWIGWWKAQANKFNVNVGEMIIQEA